MPRDNQHAHDPTLDESLRYLKELRDYDGAWLDDWEPGELCPRLRVLIAAYERLAEYERVVEGAMT